MFRLDLAGFFEDEYKSQVEQLTADGIAQFYGFQEDPQPYYSAADCIVLPSYHEGMSNVLPEASATGRPIITSDIPGCREALSPGESGLLCQVRDAQSLYEAMGLAGRARMEARFDRDQVVEAVLSSIM